MKILRILSSVVLCLALATPAFAGIAVNLDALKDITSGQVTVDTSADKIPATSLSGRKTIVIVNRTGAELYIGESDVDTNDAWIEDNESIAFDIDDSTDIYGVLGSGSGTVVYWEIR